MKNPNLEPNLIRNLAARVSREFPRASVCFDDLIQVGTKVYIEKYKDFDPNWGTKYTTYIWKHLYHAMREEMRKDMVRQKREENIDFTTLDLTWTGYDSWASSTPTPEQSYLQSERMALLGRAVATAGLTANEKALLEARYSETPITQEAFAVSINRTKQLVSLQEKTLLSKIKRAYERL